MKKLLIVNNNMKVGGVQKSLLNLLWSLEGQYEVTLCLFSPQGAYLQQLPATVEDSGNCTHHGPAALVEHSPLGSH